MRGPRRGSRNGERPLLKGLVFVVVKGLAFVGVAGSAEFKGRKFCCGACGGAIACVTTLESGDWP